MAQIVDISSNNGLLSLLNFQAMKAQGVEHIIIRASLGYNTADTQLQHNALLAAQAGLKVSYYHFAYPDTKTGGSVIADATNEGKYFSGLIAALPNPEFLVVDFEPFNSKGLDSPLSPADYQTWMQNFLSTVKANTGQDCIIYTYAAYLTQHLPANHPFGNYKLWIANYSNTTNPPLPNGWTTYFMWQYSASGKIAGINSTFDFSKFG